MTTANDNPKDDGQDPTIDHSITRILNQAGGEGVRLAESTEPTWGDGGEVDDAIRKLGEQVSGKRYTIEKLIAKGGMGMVFNAQDLNVRRKIAMKVMRPEAEASADQVVRFIEEAQVTGQLEHPGIVPVHELGVDATGNVFYTMKLIKGKTLKEILQALGTGDKETIEAFPLTRLMTIFQKVCDAIAYSHNKHVVHRDLKPENIMIGEYGEVHVVDWGLAKVVDSMKPSVADEIGTDTDAMMEAVNSLRQDDSHKGYATMHGQVLGTPKYMAPEQAMGVIDSIDARTDVYSLGSILYNILTLSTPVSGDSVHALLTKVILGEIVQPSEYNSGGSHEAILPHCPTNRIPDGLGAVTMKAMATKKENRYQSVEDLQADVDSWMNGYAPSAENAGVGRQARLFVRRHRPIVTLAASSILIIFSLLIFVAVTAKQGEARALSAMRQAEDARKEAEIAKRAIAESEEKLKTIANKTAAETWQKAMNCLKGDDLAQAQEHLDVCERLNPDDPRLWLMKGRMELLKLNLEGAKKHFMEYKKRAGDAQADKYLGILKQLEMASAEVAANTTPGWNPLSEVGSSFKTDRARRLEEMTPRSGSQKAEVVADEKNIEAEEKASEDVLSKEGEKVVSAKRGTKGKKTNTREDLDYSQNGPRKERAVSPVLNTRQSRMEFIANQLSQGEDKVLAANMFKRMGQRRRGMTIQAELLKDELKKQQVLLSSIDVVGGDSADGLKVDLQASIEVRDVTVLNNMPIRELNISQSNVQNLGKLNLTSVKRFTANDSNMVDVKPLVQMPLTELYMANTKISDFDHLGGMKLKVLDLSGTQVADVAWLTNMPLKTLILKNTAISDITPLAGMNLVEVDLRNTKVTDFSVLKTMTTLKRINGMDAATFWKNR